MDYSEREYTNFNDMKQLLDWSLMCLYNGNYTSDNYSSIDTHRLVDLVMAHPRAAGMSRDVTHKKVRAGLQTMSGMGTVEQVTPRYGSSKTKHRWQLKRKEWNRNDPFSVMPGAGQVPASEYAPIAPIATSYGDKQLTAQQEENRKLKSALEDLTKSCQQTLEENARVEAENARLKAENETASQRTRIIKVERYDKTKLTLKDQVLPKQFDDLKDLMECRMNILLVGPAGCGKTYAAEMAAKVLGLPFAAISCSAGMSEAHLTGRVRPKLSGDDLFQTTDFLEMYENGGVMLLDELDAADPNLLLTINTALANGYCNVPNRDSNRRASRNDDFVCVGTANTFGRGATRMYSGRNQLDEATVDRFRMGMIEMDYDRVVEEALCPDEELRNWCWRVREGIDKAQLRRIMSSRFMRDAYRMKDKGWPLAKIQKVFFNGWGDDERNKVTYQMTYPTATKSY